MIRFSKTYPSFLTVKEGSTFLTKPLFPQGREDVTALRCSEPLRYKVGGPSKAFAMLCGMGPPEEYKYLHGRIVHSIQLLHYSYSLTGLSKILFLTICLSFLCLHHNNVKNIVDIAVNIVTIKNTDEAIGDEEKSATNKEHRKEAKIETDAIANSKHKSDVLLLHNSSISSFVTS